MRLRPGRARTSRTTRSPARSRQSSSRPAAGSARAGDRPPAALTSLLDMDLDVHTTARERLVDELRQHALVIGEVVLTSGRTAQYLGDAVRAILRSAGRMSLAVRVAARAR